MPLAIQSSAATGGLSAALVSTLFRTFDSPAVPPVICQDFQVSDWHWPSLIAGVFLGLALGQLLEGLIIARHFLALQLRHRAFSLTNSWNIRSRSG